MAEQVDQEMAQEEQTPEVPPQGENVGDADGTGPTPPTPSSPVDMGEGHEDMIVEQNPGTPPPLPPTYVQLGQRIKKIHEEVDFLVQRNLNVQLSVVAVASAIAGLSESGIDEIILDRSGEEMTTSQASSTGSSKSGSGGSSQHREPNDVTVRRYEEMCLELGNTAN